MPGIDYRALRAAVSLQQVLELLRFQPTRRRGHKLRGHCPIHDPGRAGDRHFFSADLDANHFRCFGCGKGGNQLDLWSLAQGSALYPAALDLCGRLHITPPLLPPKSVSTPRPRDHSIATSARSATA